MDNNFMNEPGKLIEVSERNIIEEYRIQEDVSHVSKVFGVTKSEVRKILKQAGIQVKNSRVNKVDLDPLRDVGMSERNFYRDNND